MANLKELKTRITSVKSTKQITSAMKMVAASKLRKAQDKIINLRPYAEKMEGVVKNLVGTVDDITEFDLLKPATNNRKLIVLLTSNKGLCGGFNSNVIKHIRKLVENDKSIDLYCVGKKGYDYFSRRDYSILDQNIEVFDSVCFENATKVSNRLIELFVSGKYGKIDIVYNKFKNAGVQILVQEALLPFKTADTVNDDNHKQSNYLYEPSQFEILSELLPKAVRMQFYKAVLDSNASEQGARMTAMHKATENATELIKDLSIVYNKARQAAITNEIIEIVSGANAMKG